MIERLLRLTFKHQDIVHKGSLYLRRFFVAKIAGWELVVHKICRPDADAALHDHPSDFATLALRAGYVEQVLHPDGVKEETLVRGQLRFRSSDHTHRISRILGPEAWTLVVRGPKNRSWGFWDVSVQPPKFTVAREYFGPGYDQAEPPRRGLREAA